MACIAYQVDPTLIECHLLKVTSDMQISAADDFVAIVDKVP